LLDARVGFSKIHTRVLRQEEDLPVPIQQVVRLLVINILVVEGPALAKTSWLKPLGQGLWEFRIGGNVNSVLKRAGVQSITSFGNQKLLIRVFCAFESDVVLLIGCYNKLKFSGGRPQSLAITRARKVLLTFREGR
jgi:hypothetical protein